MTATGPFRQAIEDAAAQGYVSQTRSPFASVRRQAAPAGPTVRLASDKQRAFLQKLISEQAQMYADAGRDIEAEATRRTLVGLGPELAAMTAADASAAIDRAIKSNRGLRSQLANLEADRRAKTAAARDQLEDGTYQLPDGTVAMVYHTVHGANVQVAKVWDTGTGRFEYSGRRILRQITPAMRMTLEQAQAFGQVYGVCSECGRLLTDEDSKAAGIGPVCAKKF